jgi:hypothetical protein
MICQECTMAVAKNEYHPFGACLMFKACNDSDIVRANLAAICEWGKNAEATGFQCLRCGGVYNGQGHRDLCPQCQPPPVDNLHVAEGCEQFAVNPEAKP